MTIDKTTLYDKAILLHQTGHLPEAITHYKQLLSLDPHHREAMHGLGLAFAENQDTDQAIKLLNQALTLEPTNPILHNHLANLYKRTHAIDKAIDHYQQALSLNPDYAQAHHNLGTLYALQAKFQMALHHYRLAVHADPTYIEAHYHLGLLLLKNQHLDAAKKQFNNVLALQPYHLEAQFYHGVLALEANDLDTAKHAFNAILTIDEEHVEAITNLGVIALKEDLPQLAIDYFTKALSLDHEHLEARNNLAATFIHHDRFENALMHYDVLLKNDPHHIEYLYNSGVAQMALGHLQEAIDHFETLLSVDDYHFDTLNNLAAICLRINQHAKAIALLERALLVKPNDEVTQFLLDVYQKHEKQREACPTYTKNLFNNYALYYDEHLKGPLNYTLPQVVGRLLHQFVHSHIKKAIDLGCGTGLCAGPLREMSDHLTGIDISSKMLAQAKEKGVYDELIESELISFLDANTDLYDLAIAMDVLPYLGALDSFFQHLYQRLASPSLLIFTHEISVSAPWQLQESARFCHHPDYVHALSRQQRFELLHQEKIIARQQNEQAVEVMIYVMSKA